MITAQLANLDPVEATRQWVERIVVGLNLCPFAKRELVADRVRFVLVDGNDVEPLLATLHDECLALRASNTIETTLLVFPAVLREFEAYNDALGLVDTLLEEWGFEGEFQVASFHPDYVFAGEDPKDMSHYTNRSPYPVFHILRESSLEKAIAAHPDVEGIPERNIERLRELGLEGLRGLYE